MKQIYLLFIYSGICLYAYPQVATYQLIAEQAMNNAPNDFDLGFKKLPPTYQFGYGLSNDDFWPNPGWRAMNGETGGFDTYMTVDPRASIPGQNEVHFYDGTHRLRHNSPDGSQPGDRFFLGDHARPYFAGRTGTQIDADFAYIEFFVPEESKLYLHGSPKDYVVVDVSQPYSGAALFLKKGNSTADDDDLIAILLDVNANDVQPNSINFEYAVAPQASVFQQNGIDQFTTDAVELWSAIDLDDAGNIYMAVRSPKNISPNANTNCGCDLIAIKYDPSGNILWQGNYGDGRWLSVGETSRVYDAVYDNGYFYLGIFKGNSLGLKGGVYQIVKIDAINGAQFGLYEHDQGPGVDNITGITHDNAGYLYLSGSSNSSINKGPGPYFQKIDQSLISSGSAGLINWVDGGFANTFFHEGHGGVDFMSTSSTPGVGLIANSGWYLVGPQNHHALWLRVWNDSGNLLQYVELTDSDDDPGWAWQVRFDSAGFIYVAGVIHGPLADFPNLTYNGFSDIVVFKVDPANYNVVDATLIGTPWSDEAVAMVIENDELYIVGHTYGSLYATNPTPGVYADGFLVKLDTDLKELASLQMGTEKEDHFTSVRVFNSEVYISGYTEGSFFDTIDTNQYNTDAFVFKRDASTLLNSIERN